MGTYSLIGFLVYFGLLIYIVPKSTLQFDVFQLQFRLLPHWFKFLALAFLLVAIISAILFSSRFENWFQYFMAIVNFSFFVFFFSRQKIEDEFSASTRIKSFIFSFVGFVAIVGAFSFMDIETDSTLLLSNLYIQLLLGASLLQSILYFYITVYKFRKTQ